MKASLIKLTTCIVLICVGNTNTAQFPFQEKLDSLEEVFGNSYDDTTFLSEYVTSLMEYNSDFPSESVPYYWRFLSKVDNEQHPEFVELATNDLGVTYYYLGDFDSTIYYLKKSYELAEEIDYRLSIERLSNLAAVYGVIGESEKELKSILDVVEAAEELNDSTLMLSAFNSLGGYYYAQGEYATAVEYFKKGIQVGEAGYDAEYLSQLYLNIAVALEKLEDQNRAKEYYDLAIDAATQFENYYDLASAHVSLGGYYLEQEDREEAKNHYDKALGLSDSLGYAELYANAGLSLSRLLEESDLKRAIQLQEEAYGIYSSAGYIRQMITCLKHLENNYRAQGNTEKAYQYLRTKEKLKDSVRRQNKEEALAEMRTKYETDKIRQQAEIDRLAADLEIKEQQEKTEEQRFYFILASGGGLVLLLTAFLLVRLNRIRKKANTELKYANTKIERQKAEIEEINLNLTDSIHYAKKIQDSILPSDQRLSEGLGDVFVYFRPRDVVSGDFYWFHEDGDKVVVAAADCTGHGVPGAFVSMVCQSVLNKIVVEDEVYDPGEILTKAHKGVVETFKKESTKSQANDGMDVSLTVWDKQSATIQYAGAMNSMILVRDEELIEFKADRRGIGGEAELDFQYETKSLVVEKGDMIYQFSDGYQDQFGGPKGKKFMIKRLKQIFSSMATLSVEEQEQILDKTFREWIGNQEQIDDVLLLGYRIS